MDTVHPDSIVLSTAALEKSRSDKPKEHFRRYLRFRGTKPNEPVALEAISPSSELQKYRSSALLAVSSTEPCLFQLLHISDSEILPRGCFIQQNELHAYVAARQPPDQWVKLGRDEGLKDDDIASRRAFYFDFDVRRGKNVSSTDAELAKAYVAAEGVLRVLVEILGDDAPLGLALSGNGVHVHVALDGLPNTSEVTTLVREFCSPPPLSWPTQTLCWTCQ